MRDVWRVVHIFSGVVWVGGYAVVAMFVAPSARRAGDAARPFMQTLLRTRLTETLVGAGVATVLSGGFLYAERFGAIDVTGRSGLWLTVGATAGILALAVGYGLGARANLEMRRIASEVAASGGPPTDDQAARMQTLQRRITVIAPYMLGVFAVAVLGMALGG